MVNRRVSRRKGGRRIVVLTDGEDGQRVVTATDGEGGRRVSVSADGKGGRRIVFFMTERTGVR